MQYTTKRLSVGPFLQENIDAGIDLLTNADVSKTYMLPDFKNCSEAAALYSRMMNLSISPTKPYISAIHYQNKMIGLINETERNDEFIEIGYAIHPDYWGKGFATEALNGALVWLLRNGFREIRCGAFQENTASIRVMQKCGMRKIEKVDEISYRGKLHFCVYYAANEPNIHSGY